MPLSTGETLPRGLRGSLAIGFALIVLFVVLVPASGAGLASPRAPRDQAPPYGDGKTAPKGKSDAPACSLDVSPSDPAIKQKFPGGQSPTGDVCGSFGADSITVSDRHGGGTQIWAGPDDDIVNAQNHKADEILVGQGKNSVTIDSCDHVADAKYAHVKKVKGNCTDVAQSHRFQSATAVSYPYQEPDILCTVSTTGKRLISIAHEPTMRAFDTTSNVDWQTVAFSALLYKWNGSSYVFTGDQRPWVEDRAPDEQLVDFGQNFWHPFDSPSHQPIFFNPTSAGRYRIEIDYHWYAANPKDDKDLVDWASYHFGHYGSAGQGYCNFPGPPPKPGHYAGTSDEGIAVSFDAAAIFPNVPTDVAGSRLTNLVFATSVSCTPARTFTEPLTIDPGRWIQLGADNSFAYTRVGGLTSQTRQNETASYFFAGKIDTSGNAAGSVYIQQLSFDQNGTHYDCAGKPHAWTAKLG